MVHPDGAAAAGSPALPVTDHPTGPVTGVIGGNGGATVTAVLIAQDEAERIAQAVRSCRAFTDDVLVVDGGSTDGTVAAAEAAGARVIANPWPGYAEQRAFALSRATGDWIFFLDADEVVGEQLAASVRAVVAADGPLDGYELQRVGDFFGRWVGPDTQLRLARRSTASVTRTTVHERIDVGAGRTGELSGVLWHFGFRSTGDHLRRFERYTQLEAEERYARGERFSPVKLAWRPAGHAALELLGRGLFRKGTAGVAVAGFWAVYEFLVQVKLYELQWRREGSTAHEPPAD